MGLFNKPMGTPLSHDISSMVQRGTQGLLGVETATGYWGLSSYNTWYNPIFLIEDSTMDNNGFQVDLAIINLFVPNVSRKNIVKLSETLFITDPEQTVCDMVRYNRHEFHLYETIINAYSGGVNIKRMERIAAKHGVLNKLRHIYNQAINEIDFDNE